MARKQKFRWNPVALAAVLAVNPTLSLSQVTPASGGPAVTSASNGVPVVNIVAPNGAGVSHNRYAEFNVNSRGLILNNSTQPVITQLGGGMIGNADLGGSSARIILNEVVQANRSTLSGFVEVGGTAADVVLANPNGISCNGCGFINTPRVTLTTGTPNLDGGGNLSGFSVQRGDILIDGAGLNGSTQQYFDILARAVNVQGQLNARDAVVAGGAHAFDYATRTVTSQAGTGTAPTIGIDSSLLGGMYVDRIRLITTEAGVGVRLLGDVGANVDDLVLSAAGQIQLQKNLTAKRDLTVAGNGVVTQNAVVAAGRTLSVSSGAGALDLTGGTLGSDGDATFTGASLTDRGGTGAIRFADNALALNITGASTISDATWNGSSALDVRSGSLTASGNAQLSSADTGGPSGTVSIGTSNNLALGNAQVVGGRSVLLSSTGGNMTLGSSGRVQSGGDTQVSVNAGSFTNAGSVSAQDGLSLTGNTIVNNAGASLIGDTLAVNVATLNNSGGIKGTNGGNVVATSLNNTGGTLVGSTTSGADLVIASNALSNTGTIQSAGDLSIAAKGTLTNSGTLLADESLKIALRAPLTDNLTIDNTGAGKMQAGSALVIRGHDPAIDGGARSGRGLSLNNAAGATLNGQTLEVRADLLDNTGTVRAETTGQIDATRLINETAGSVIAFAGTNGTNTITAAGTQGVDNRGKILSGSNLNINAGKFNNSDTSAVYAKGDLNIQSTGSLDNIGLLATDSGHNMALSGTTVTNNLVIGGGTGEIVSGGTLNIDGTSSVTNRGYIDARGDVTVTTPAFTNETVRPAVVADSELHLVPGTKTAITYRYSDAAGLMPAGEYWLNDQNLDHQEQRGSIRPAFVQINLITSGVLYTTANGAPSNCYQQSSCPDFYRLEWMQDASYYAPRTDPSPRSAPWDESRYMYRNWTGQVYSGSKFATDPAATQAHIVTYGNLNIRSNMVNNSGARLEAANNISFQPINGSGTLNNADMTLVQNVYQALGREKWSYDETSPGRYGDYALANHTLYNALDAVNTTGAAGTAAVAMLGGSIRAGGTVSTTGMTLVNGSRPVVERSNNFVASFPSAPGGGTVAPATPGGQIAVPGLNLALPVNPNGLFITNQNPNARYLIESNPLYASLESPALGSDYLVNKLGLNPDAITQRLGDPQYETRLVMQQYLTQASPGMVKTSTNQVGEMKRLMDNAVWQADSLKLSFGVALTAEQANALKQDMVWMVETTVAGHRVLAPVVYLASASRAVAQDSRIVADKIVVTDAQSFVNTGSVQGRSEVTIRSSGDILNVGGNITGGDVLLKSSDGNVINATVVNRSGDADNHRDFAGLTATIGATGNLSIESTRGSITSIGGDLNAGGDALLKAGRDVTLKNIVTETKTTTEKSWSGPLGIDSHSERIVTVDQESRGSNLSAGGNLTVSTGRNATLQGSQVTARGDVDVTAKRINITNATTTDSREESRSSSGFGSGTGTGTVGWQSSSSESSTVTTHVIASGLSGGGNVTLSGERSVTVKASDVAAGGNLTVNTRRLTSSAAQQTSETKTHTSSLSVSLSGSNDLNKVEGGISGSRTTTDGNESISVARVSTLASGGNMALNIKGGTIAYEGTQVASQGDFSQTARTIDMRAAQNSYSSDTSSTTTAGGMTAGAYFNAGTFGDQAKSGQIPSVGLPSVMVGATGSRSDSNSSQSGTQAVTTNITSRGNFTSTSTGKTTIEGSQIQAGNVATLRAGELDFKAAQNTSSQSSSNSNSSGGAQVGIDAMGKATGGAQGAYSDGNQSSSQTTAVTGSIVSNGGTVIATSGNATFEGTNLRSGGATSIAAGGNVNFNAAKNTSTSSSSSQSYAGQVGQDASGTGDNKQATGSFARENGSSSSSTAVVGSIASQGGITVTAGTGDVVMQGTNVSSERGNVAVSAGRDVRMEAAVSTASSESSNMGGSLSGGKGEKGKGGNQFSASGSYGEQSSSQTIETGGSLSGRNVTIVSGGNTLLHGTDVNAQKAASITTGGQLTMQSAQSTSTSSGAQYGGELGVTQNTKGDSGKESSAGGGQVGFNYGVNDSNSVINRNAQVAGSTVRINTGGDMTMKGANINGGQVQANVGGNLTIESRVDTSSTSSTGASGYLGGSGFNRNSAGKRGQYGGDVRTGISGSASSQDSSRTKVGKQSGITGGDVAVNVLTGNTTLTGATVSGSAQGGSTILNTRSLTQNSIDVGSSQSGFSGSGSVRIGNMDLPGGGRNDGPSTSGVVTSSVGAPGQTIQATVSVAAVSDVIKRPAVQVALQLSKDMKAAVAGNGGASDVPTHVVRRILTDAGIPAANAGDTEMMQAYRSSVAAGREEASRQLKGANIPAAQVTSVLKAFNVPQ
jgi:filamentous hemagglutinin family protein